MDVDAYVAAHGRDWDRLEALSARAGRLSGREVDELVTLYSRTSTHLSVVRSSSADPALVARLSRIVASARAAVTGTDAPAWRDLARFFAVSFPAATYRALPWWTATALAWVALSFAIGWWVAANPEVQATIAAPAEIRRLVEVEFENYYSSNPAGSFAARVWTNNAWVAAASIAGGVLLGLPVLFMLWQNALNVGIAGGLMAAHGRSALFFGLILPHGLLELTAVLVAAGVGLRIGWTVIDPGARPRGPALAEEGRAAIGVALGLAVVLFVSGLIEAFVTPSSLPTWARIAIGVLAELAFLAYVLILGRRAARAGETGDVRAGERADAAPYAA